ncbi:MAG: ArsB/NhaD family transporter [Thermococci archaeon]|nr:ArsB/NhaD family transporter [Thermococci archaeon]
MNPQSVAAVVVFLAVYSLIITEKVHRTVAAMTGASVLLLTGIVPWSSAKGYIDLDTILLLAGMMVVVNVARDSGMFEYVAIKTAKLAGGSPIKVLLLFSGVTAVVSAFLDNVTTVLLLTPMLIYITRRMGVDPVPFLLSEVFASNIGGTATLIGDPPNIMIGSAAKLSFNDFVENMAPIALITLGVTIALIFLFYRHSFRSSSGGSVMLIDEREAIKDPALLKKSLAVLSFVIFAFFFHDLLGIEPAAVALIGASILLLWSGIPPEKALGKVEWATLFFFGGLFVLVGGLVQTGVIDRLASIVTSNVHSEAQAIVMISGFSAAASAVVDNIPFTATMIPLIKAMGAQFNTYPLWWALSLGACLGGNGTAIGASANVVVLGIAYREGIRITFKDFLKVGLVVMVSTVGVGTLLLLIRYGGLI